MLKPISSCFVLNIDRLEGVLVVRVAGILKRKSLFGRVIINSNRRELFQKSEIYPPHNYDGKSRNSSKNPLYLATRKRRETFWNMWKTCHWRDFQLQWKLDFRMNGFRLEKLVDIARPCLKQQDTQLRKAIPFEKRVVFMAAVNGELLSHVYGRVFMSSGKKAKIVIRLLSFWWKVVLFWRVALGDYFCIF